MRTVFSIPQKTLDAQRNASNPNHSAWVGANAGSGKTHVLASRVIRLLLNGANPQKILCLTYTKAAAANMANRVFETLSLWALMDDNALHDAIKNVQGTPSNQEQLTRARKLFARALETPGGLKIQTIHAFCEAILHQFPLEANIAGHFEMLDGTKEAALVTMVRRQLLTDKKVSADFTNALYHVLDLVGEFGLNQLLENIIADRSVLSDFLSQTGGAQNAFEILCAEYGLDATASEQTMAQSVLPLAGFDVQFVDDLDKAALQLGAVRGREKCSYPAKIAYQNENPVVRLKHLANALLSSTGEPYKTSWLFSKALLKDIPDLEQRYEAACNAILPALDKLAILGMLKATKSALEIANELISKYEASKRHRGLLDFNDLIERTAKLLRREDAGPWVHYKLDRGIDHILVDEAQDTSPDQWDVITQLTQEFFAGEGSRPDVKRTVFAVGDEKQSIYSFQGARPRAFGDKRGEFQERAKQANQAFHAERLPYSFRSTPDVLGAVDYIFKDKDARDGLTYDVEEVEHSAIREKDAGSVEVWPMVAPQINDEPEDWRQAVDHASAPAVQVSDNIAHTIDQWLKNGEMIIGQGRKMTPGDILVLVRKRDRFIHALSRTLKNLGVPVAGADRLKLTDHIGVQDLLAVGRFSLQPHDDLSLAAVLKSPIFCIDDDLLMELALPRAHFQTLWDCLKKAALGGDIRFAPAYEMLVKWRNEAAFKPAADFFATILGRDKVRAKMIARLGLEAGEIIDMFCAFLLDQEQMGLGDMERLLAHLETDSPQIKREMDQNRGEVRIMTVHSAKGLEAPVVFLVDSGGSPYSVAHRAQLIPVTSKMRKWSGEGMIWRATSAYKNSILASMDGEEKQQAKQEYRRLLYVGMTRAEDRLIICGYRGKTQTKEQTWHSMAHAGLLASGHCEEIENERFELPILSFSTTPQSGKAISDSEKSDKPAPHYEFPFDPDATVPQADELPAALSPSRAIGMIEKTIDIAPAQLSPVLDDVKEPSFAIRQGLAVHKLMQVLPQIDQNKRHTSARNWLQLHHDDWSENQIERCIESVTGILNNQKFAEIFTAKSAAEVAISGTLKIQGKDKIVSGIIDRLAVGETNVLIIDYKTNRVVPEFAQDAAQSYVLQMALYRALLTPLYPGKKIDCALLYTQGPSLIELGDKQMDLALAQLM